MHLLFTTVSIIIEIVLGGSILLYAPFARDLSRALIIPFVLALLWSLFRVACIFIFGESSPPMIAFLLAPFAAVFYAGLARGAKMLLFQIPFLSRREKSLRVRFTKSDDKPNSR